LFFLAAAGISGAEQPAAQVVFLRGIVDLHRDGQIIELFESDVGMTLHNQDLLETGNDGALILELTGLASPGSRITVAENTAFFLEVRGAGRLRIPLLAGSLSLKIESLLSSESLSVRSQTVTLGVRGTEFAVTLAPEGSLLVICSQGLVECQDEQGRPVHAQPGQAVERRSGESLRGIGLDSGEEALYQSFWTGQRNQVFRAGAPTFIRAYAQQYQNYLPRFSEAYQKVAAHQGTLLRYRGGAGELNRDLLLAYTEISRDLVPALGVINLFEQVFYSVRTLQGFHSQGIGVSRISANQTSQEFFNNFNSYEPILQRQLAQTHYLYKLFMEMAETVSPGGLLPWD
jgi:hypothetical protein